VGKKVIVYIDGFNLYNGTVKDYPHYKWLDLVAFSKRLMPQDDVIKVKYFTAKVNGHLSQKRQLIYWDALTNYYPTLFTIIEGFFVNEKKIRPIAGYQYRDRRKASKKDRIWIINTNEKCTDVNLAVHLLNDAWKNEFESALIISNDSDLREAIIVVKDELKKDIIIANPHLWHSTVAASELSKLNLQKRKISESQLKACQLPDPIPGTTISKPPEWN